MYAEILNNQVIKYPYTLEQLQSDNPYTNYDERYDVVGWYNLTEKAITTGSTLVDVEEQPFPEYNGVTQAIIKHTVPVYKNDKWIFGWDIVDKTQERIDLEQSLLLPPSQ
jgi:hypothetical protein